MRTYSVFKAVLGAAACLTLTIGAIGCGDSDTTTGGTDTVQVINDAGGGGGGEADTTGKTDNDAAAETGSELDGGATADTSQEDTGPVEPEYGCATGKSCFQGKCCTCTPVGCEAGIDNSLSGLSGLANGSLQGTLDDGSINLIAELNYAADGEAFPLNMYQAKLVGDETCDVAVDTCDWELGISAFTEACVPLINFDNAVINGNTLTAGGPDGLFQLNIPIQGFELALTVTMARIEGTVERDGDKITKFSGILAGAVPKKTLEDAIDALPDSGLPISKEAIKNIISNVVKADIDGLDADGNPNPDGVVESASVAIVFEGIPGNITGVSVPAEGDTPACATPPAADTFSPIAFRLTSLLLGDSGTPGQGLDVDGICAEPVAADDELCPAE